MWKAIINWINRLNYQCEHNWEKLQTVDVYTNSNSKRPYETKHVYRCTKCCNYKKIIT